MPTYVVSRLQGGNSAWPSPIKYSKQHLTNATTPTSSCMQSQGVEPKRQQEHHEKEEG